MKGSTGLTPTQEKAVSLLVSGKTVTDVAKECDVDRTTIHNWQKLPTFQAMYNALRFEAKQSVENAVFSLYTEALNTLKGSLRSENEAVALKTALHVIGQIQVMQPGQTDAREIVKRECTKDNLDSLMEELKQTVNMERYRERCLELGIEP